MHIHDFLNGTLTDPLFGLDTKPVNFAEENAPERCDDQTHQTPEVSSAAAKNESLLKSKSFSIYLFGLFAGTPWQAKSLSEIDAYLQAFLDDALPAADSRDVMLSMLAEQALLVHHASARLYCDAIANPDLDYQQKIIQSAVSLTAEHRRVVSELVKLRKQKEAKCLSKASLQQKCA
ncbi:MAG: hypothetical protein KDB03_03180 [Planctomycetales bacterium]|nr:hypothetical protein [Planctomycetales bacterium]